MRIGLGNDHHGIELKNRIIEYLKRNNIEYKNYGCDSKEDSENIDFVDYALNVCNGINNKEIDLGILICGTGIGMSIAANKVDNIMAAKVATPREAHLCRDCAPSPCPCRPDCQSRGWRRQRKRGWWARRIFP